jgi:molecular chaperone GrpE
MTVLREILPVVDNLERAVAAAGVTEETRGIREGVELVLRQFTQTLEKLQVVKVEAHGRPFDPNVHEAVGQIPTAEHPPGTVVDVLQPGYTIGNRLLRAAMCVVASAPPPVEPEPEPEPEIEIEIEQAPAEQASEPESGATEE